MINLPKIEKQTYTRFYGLDIKKLKNKLNHK